MPRVPEFNVDRNISTRVENEALPRIMADTRQLQAIGAQALKIEDQLVKAKESADVLKTNSTLEKSLDNTMPEIENLFSSIENKKIDPDEGLKQINEKMDSYDADATGALAASGVADKAGEMYATYTAPRIAKIRQKAELLATNRKVANQVDSLESDIKIHNQRFIDGVSSPEDLQTLLKKISDPAVTDLIGVDKQDRLLAGANRSFASSATQFISSQGATEQNIAVAKKLISTLPEDERRHSERVLDETVKRTQEIGVNKTYAGYQSLLKKMNTPKDIVENAPALNNMTATLIDSPLGEFENAQRRKEVFSSLMAKQIAAEVFVGNPTITNLEEAGIEAKVETLTNGLSKRQIASIFGGVDNLKASVTASVQDAIAEYNSLRFTNPVEYYAGMDDVIGKLTTSNNPADVENAIFKLSDAYNKTGVPMGMRDIVSPDQADAATKNIKMFTKKGYDPSGEQLYGYITNIANKYGEYSQLALMEHANKSKEFPNAMIAIPRMNDVNNAMSVTSGYNNYEAYLETLRDSKVLADKKGKPKNEYEAIVQKKISEEMSPYISMVNGLPDKANPIYKSIRDSVQYMAVDVAIKAGSKDIDAAISTAINNVKQEFPLASDGVNSIMIDSKYAAENRIDVNELPKVLKSLKQMEFVDSLDSASAPKLDFESLDKQFSNSPLSSRVKAITMMAKTNRTRAMEMFADTFEDSLVISPDPAYPNKVAYYIKDRTAIIPVIGTDGKGKLPMSIDVGAYYRKSSAKTIYTQTYIP